MILPIALRSGAAGWWCWALENRSDRYVMTERADSRQRKTGRQIGIDRAGADWYRIERPYRKGTDRYCGVGSGTNVN